MSPPSFTANPAPSRTRELIFGSDGSPHSDTIKTRIQRATALQGETPWTRFKVVTTDMFKQEGPSAFYKGITPRVMRVAPGQAVVFAVYERMKTLLETLKSDVLEYSE